MEADPIRTVKVNATFNYKLGDQIKSEGNSGTLVFKGFFNGTIPIALKRYPKVDENTIKDVEKNLDVLSSPENKHPNFIRYYGHATDDNFGYLATELCECSVADIIDPKKKIKAHEKTIYFEAIVASLPKKEILRQSSEAVSFLHRPRWNMIHRNLHPDNFLIACVDPNKDYFLIKLTDFQLSKSIDKNPQNTGTLNKEGWVAPESFNQYVELDNKVDAFILGCYYFYVLSGGKHPFGRGVVDQRTRIKDINDKVYRDSWDGKPEWNIDLANFNEEEEAKWALELIKSLIKYDPNDRKSVDEVLKSKYFQPEPYMIYDHPKGLKVGLCVIVTQSKYHNATLDVGYFDDQGIPKGIEIDSRNLENTFSHFGYEVLHFKNLRAAQMVEYLSPEQLAIHAGVSSLNEFASLIICILGHGEKDAVNGVDGTLVRHNRLQYAFNGVLRDKPKILINVSCQGDNDQLILDRNDPLFSPPMVTTLNMAPSSAGSNRMPPLIDFLSLMSTIEEFHTSIDFNRGSEFTNALCDSLRHEYNVDDPSSKKDLVQLFSTAVIPRVGRSGIRKMLPQANGPDLQCIIKQTPECRSSLTKTIRFKRTPIPGAARLIYDGEFHDPCFEIGRIYFRNLSLMAYPLRHTPEPHFALSKNMSEFRRTETPPDSEKNYSEQGETDNSLNVCRACGSSIAEKKGRIDEDSSRKVEAIDESADAANTLQNIESQTRSLKINSPMNSLSETIPEPYTFKALVSTTPANTITEDWVHKQNIRYNREQKLAYANGICVFKGFFGNDQPAAVKRFNNDLTIDEENVEREAQYMRTANGHANILRYFGYEMDKDFLYLATELCRGTLQHLVEGELKNELGESPFHENEKEILLQVTKGLAHLHSLNIIHRDVKPTNLLIYQPEGMTAAVMKVADFGISKELKPEQDDTTNSSKTNPSGTRGWISPEKYQPGRYGCKVDIFALGLVFGYTLSEVGKHPYGDDPDERVVRIKKGEETDDLTLNYFKKRFSGNNGLAFELIQFMLTIDPVRRPTALQVLKHAFFQ